MSNCAVIDTELLSNLGQRLAGCIEISCFGHIRFGQSTLDNSGTHTSALEVIGDCRLVNTKGLCHL